MKGLLSLLLGISLFLFLPSLSFAAVSVDPCANNNLGQYSNLCNLGKDKPGDIIGRGVVAVLVIASLISLVYLLWGGAKWIYSGGDKAKVDAARQAIVAAIIGLIVSFSAYFILSIVLALFGINFGALSIPTITESINQAPGNNPSNQFNDPCAGVTNPAERAARGCQ